MRIDRWLFCARLFRTRGIAAEAVGSGAVRLNGRSLHRPGRSVRPGDVLTINARQRGVLVLRVRELPDRRAGAGAAVEPYDFVNPASVDS